HRLNTGSVASGIAFGEKDTITNSSDAGIFSGEGNYLTNSSHSSILSGFRNRIYNNEYSAIVSGDSNTILNTTGSHNFVGSGNNNNITSGDYNSILNGIGNSVYRTSKGVILSGYHQLITDSAEYATILNGYGDTVMADFGLATGLYARAGDGNEDTCAMVFGSGISTDKYSILVGNEITDSNTVAQQFEVDMRTQIGDSCGDSLIVYGGARFTCGIIGIIDTALFAWTIPYDTLAKVWNDSSYLAMIDSFANSGRYLVIWQGGTAKDSLIPTYSDSAGFAWNIPCDSVAKCVADSFNQVRADAGDSAYTWAITVWNDSNSLLARLAADNVFTGKNTFGNASTDTIKTIGVIQTSAGIVPSDSGVQDLGTQNLKWKRVFTDSLIGCKYRIGTNDIESVVKAFKEGKLGGNDSVTINMSSDVEKRITELEKSDKRQNIVITILFILVIILLGKVFIVKNK
ncbi:MAG: hypothetical protein PHQ86_08210, partial [Dehalococcoidales bacterium]|nr:hypothetical protein [Dehalococcoidales bacterium]